MMFERCEPTNSTPSTAAPAASACFHSRRIENRGSGRLIRNAGIRQNSTTCQYAIRRAPSNSVLSWRGSIFFPNRGEDIQVQHRLVTDYLSPMHDVWRNLQQASGAEDDALVADVETDVARD